MEDPTAFLALYSDTINNAASREYLDQAVERFSTSSRKVDLDTERTAFLEALGSKGIPAYVPSVRFSVNSADGVAPVVSVVNLDDKTVKYTTFSLRSFNSVGDPVVGRYSESSVFSFRGVGPIAEGDIAVYGSSNDPVIYAGTVSCIELLKVEIEYFDGSKYIMQDDLADARRNPLNYKIKGECQLR